MKTKLDGKQMGTVLDNLYEKVLCGVPKVSISVDALANDYLDKNNSPEKAA